MRRTGRNIGREDAMVSTREDKALARGIRAALRADARISAGRIKVQVEDRRATLTGTLPAWSHKIAALEVAQNASGVRGVSDKMAVEPEDEVSDERAEAIVLSALAAHADILEGSIAVRVKRGLCTLAGNVPSRAVWETAERTALSCKGIRSARNLLVIDQRATVDDSVLAKRVSGVLAGYSTLSKSQFKVRSVGGRVVITGWVHSLAEKSEAARVAGLVRDVVSVSNRLRIVDDK
jgi:osmotically-inducible protein OsmY